jgi:hypothetical protein
MNGKYINYIKDIEINERIRHSSVEYKNELYIYGGGTLQNNIKNQLIKYNLKEKRFYQINSFKNFPSIFGHTSGNIFKKSFK